MALTAKSALPYRPIDEEAPTGRSSSGQRSGAVNKGYPYSHEPITTARRPQRVPQPWSADVVPEEEDEEYAPALPTTVRRRRAGQQPYPLQPVTATAPARRAQAPRVHWLLVAGLVLLGLITVYILGFWVYVWGLDRYNDLTYGMPRTFQLDAVVGHHDSAAHPTHFIAVNLHGKIDIIELPGGDANHTKIYLGPQLVSWVNPEQAVVTLTVRDLNGDGKPDLLVQITGDPVLFFGSPTFDFELLNTGDGFKPMA